MQDTVGRSIAGISGLRTTAQTADIVVMALVAGATFGIWRGYNPTGFSAASFIEMHQGAVRGLNTLLPVMGAAALLMTLTLAWVSRTTPRVLGLYALAAALMVAAALITRFGNQPINALVMGWSAADLPAGWEGLRDRWWQFHVLRTGVSVAATVALVQAVFADRGR